MGFQAFRENYFQAFREKDAAIGVFSPPFSFIQKSPRRLRETVHCGSKTTAMFASPSVGMATVNVI